jgi:REP element-mobilizing transposase RayT
VTFYRRRLPHLSIEDQPVFLTWSLHSTLPPNRAFPKESFTSGQAFAALDRLLDQVRTGPFYLHQPPIARMVVESIHHHAEVLGRYALHAFVVMPNHVHMLVSPRIPLPKLTRTLKSYTARQANWMLGLSGNPFWQEESYDHLVRDQSEFNRIRLYIEHNPVCAGLATEASGYPWSSAAEPAGRLSTGAASRLPPAGATGGRPRARPPAVLGGREV